MPLKFAYVGSAAHTHDILACSEGYSAIVGSVAEEIEVMQEGLKSREIQGPFEVIELGPGNGLHTRAFVSSLAGIMQFRSYALADYSATLLSLCLERLSTELPDIDFLAREFDLEASKLDFGGDPSPYPKLVFMFGNTLGNVEDWLDCVQCLFSQMKSGDLVMTSYAVHEPSYDTADYLRGYQTQELHAAALEPLVMTGANRQKIEFELHFDADKLAVIGEARLTEETCLSCSGRLLQLAANSRVRCFLSRRFLPDTFEKGFAEAGFSILSHDQNEAKRIGYLLVQK